MRYPLLACRTCTDRVQEGADWRVTEIPGKVHFIGIGGAGMSGLARVLLDQGYDVRGSDLSSTPVTERLRRMGAAIYTRHSADNIGDAELVVISTAIDPANPELQEATGKGVPVIHRADLLALLMNRQRGLAVAGAHGKTTTTAMLALVMEKCRLDPTILIGGELTNIGGNAKLGRGEYLVAEADESDKSFLKFKPYLAVVTNIEDDHLDHYGTVENIVAAFCQFLGGITPGGAAVLCFDDAVVRGIAGACRERVITYAVENSEADYILNDIRPAGSGSTAEVYYRGQHLGRLSLPVPGRHNLANALAVVAAGRFIGISFPEVASALRDFQGAGRRYQVMGKVDGITVVDDYAHHPTEIDATLKAARQVHPGRIITVFQPHRYTRTSLLHQRFGSCFVHTDVLIINDIYGAGEEPMPGVTAQLIVDAVASHNGLRPVFIGSRDETVSYLTQNLHRGDLVLTMGAGDVWKTGPELLNRLQGSEQG